MYMYVFIFTYRHLLILLIHKSAKRDISYSMHRKSTHILRIFKPKNSSRKDKIQMQKPKDINDFLNLGHLVIWLKSINSP